MTVDEAKKAFDELKAQGETDDDILKVLYSMYQDDKFTLDELESFVNILGYEFTDEFKAMSDEDKKTKGVEFSDEESAEGVDESEVEDAKEVTDEEKGEGNEPESNSEPEEEDDDKKAAKLFGFGDKK